MTPVFIQKLSTFQPTVAIQAIDEEISFFENEGMPQVVATLKQDKQNLMMMLEDE